MEISNEDLKAAVERLTQSKAECDKLDSEMGHRIGTDWALYNADYWDLRRIAEDESHDLSWVIPYFDSKDYDVRGLFECEELDPNPSDACVSGFLLGARTVWQKVAPRLK